MQVPFNVNINLEGKDDLLYHLITQEINLMRGNIERALRDDTKGPRKRMQEEIIVDNVVESTFAMIF